MATSSTIASTPTTTGQSDRRTAWNRRTVIGTTPTIAPIPTAAPTHQKLASERQERVPDDEHGYEHPGPEQGSTGRRSRLEGDHGIWC